LACGGGMLFGFMAQGQLLFVSRETTLSQVINLYNLEEKKFPSNNFHNRSSKADIHKKRYHIESK
jgi:hypothetical protein